MQANLILYNITVYSISSSSDSSYKILNTKYYITVHTEYIKIHSMQNKTWSPSKLRKP